MWSDVFLALRKGRGTALTYAIGLVLICSMLMAGGAGLILGSVKGGSVHLARSQAENVARGGFRDAMMWFRKNETQPVISFEPGGGASEEPEIGLVKSSPVSAHKGIWGRYEVAHAAVRDITSERGREGKGLIWEVQSVGYVYKKVDSEKRFDELPNKVIARITMIGEITRMGLTVPRSAIASYRAKQITVGGKTRVEGGEAGSGEAGLTYQANTGKTNVHGDVDGDPPQSKVNNLDIEPTAVFGVSLEELKGMADYVGEDVVDIPSPMPDMSFTYIDGNANFSEDYPLSGGGLLVVDGNMTIPANTASEFLGVIYVTGEFSASAPLVVSGALVVRGSVSLTGGSGEFRIEYNAEVIEAVKQAITQYRESKTVHIPNRG